MSYVDQDYSTLGHTSSPSADSRVPVHKLPQLPCAASSVWALLAFRGAGGRHPAVCISRAVARTAKASTGSSILRTCETKRLEGRTIRPPTTPPSADAQGSKVAQPEVITIMPVSAQLPAAYKSLQRSDQQTLSPGSEAVKLKVITIIPVSAQLPAAFRSLHGMRTMYPRRCNGCWAQDAINPRTIKTNPCSPSM